MEHFFSIRGILISILLGIGFVKTLTRPQVGVSIILALVILRDGFLNEYFPQVYDLHFPQIIIIFTLISWLLHSGNYKLRFNLDIFLMFMFFLIICFSRYNFGASVFEHKIPNEFFRDTVIFFLIVQLLRTPDDIKKVIWLIVLLHLFLILRGYYLYKRDWMEIALPNYEYVNRNSFANTLASIFPLAYMLGRMAKGKLLKSTGLIASLWCVIGVILTYSRGGFLALAAGILALLIFIKKGRWILIGVMLVLSVLILPRLSEKYFNRIKSIDTYEEDASATSRIAGNYAAINMIKEYPLFGVGAGNYNDVVMAFVPPQQSWLLTAGYSIHNVVLQAASETGFIGLFVFLFLIIRGFKNSIFLKGREDKEYGDVAVMLGIALFAIFVGQQFGQGAYYGNIYLYLPLISALKGSI